MPQVPDLSKLTSAEKDALIYALCERIAEWERRLGLSSPTRSKPPARDGLKKARRVQSLREPSGKESGGQAGHDGTTLRQVESPDEVMDHYAATCPACGEALARAAASPDQKRQVFDRPAPRPLHGTEHRAHRSGCAQGGRATQAAVPDEGTAAAQYGAGLMALVVYLPGGHLLPEDRLAELLREVFQVDLATATLAGVSHKKAEDLTELAAHMEAEVKQAPVKHLDETGYRIAGRRQWLPVAATGLLTAYRTARQRGARLTGVLGLSVHEFWRS